jgi:hypothetical protein
VRDKTAKSRCQIREWLTARKLEFSDYTATVRIDQSYYGDVSEDDAEMIAGKISAALAAELPGSTSERKQCG